MTCQGGCVGGAGQTILPQNKQSMYIEARKKSLFQNDSELRTRSSYENDDIKNIYNDYLKQPLSKESQEILHTTYKDKSKNKITN
jgi:iron only hydrogenase large subunit-like protein